MGHGGRDEWEENHEAFSENQVAAILEFCGVEIVSETFTHFLCYCPFHGNTDTPALAVDKTKGLHNCFNPSCESRGNMHDLLRRTKGMNYFKAQRTILKYKNAQVTPFQEQMDAAMKSQDDFPHMSQEKVDELSKALWSSPALDYMRGRGFTDETLQFFEVGYSAAREYPPPYKSRPEMVVVPMHDLSGNPIGVIGRSIIDKRFKNSKNLPKSRTAWNIHRAKKHGETVIVCESSFDAMRIHQAGYPGVVALLGGHASPETMNQLNRHFSRIVIMTDFDQPEYWPNCKRCNYQRCTGHRAGRDLGRAIATALPNKKIMWATYDDTCVFPHGAKDAGDMTDDEIRQCIRRSIPNLTYSEWNVENSTEALAQ